MFRSSSIFVKNIVLFMLFAVPMYGISLLINHSGSEHVKEQIFGSMQSRVHFYLNSLEEEISRVNRLKKQFITDDDLQRLSALALQMSNYDKRGAILRIQQKLQNVVDSSLYVNEASVHIPLIDRTISNAYYDEDVALSKIETLARESESRGSPFVVWNNELLIVQSAPRQMNGTTAYLAEIKLSEQKLRQTLVHITNETKGGAMLIDRERRWMLSSDGDDARHEQWVRELASAGDQKTAAIAGEDYWLTYDYSEFLGAFLAVYVPEEQFMGWKRKYRLVIWLVTAVSLLFAGLFSYWNYRLIHKPLIRLVHAFRKMEKGDLQVRLEHRHEDEFRYLYDQFNATTARLNTLISEVYEQKIRSQRSELKQLQSQINPHFLYNSFFVLYRMAQRHDHDNVARFTEHLGHYFRFITRSDADEVTLEEEYEHMKAYTEIQRTRFSRSVETDIMPLPDRAKDVEVPRLILQPLVENAFHHALEHKQKGGLLCVRFQEETGELLIEVEDNGSRIDPEQIERLNGLLRRSGTDMELTTGVFNVHRRLRIKFGDNAGLCFALGEKGGLLVRMRIPLPKEVE
ncbi:sensor histidine kinase [Paenibacillus mesophilus]|uniref:sensor histidine kinase n=1 Tax=Paenibacillus mesophilus TaxID=2582849 RepID=UPI0013054689|nr:histidine kinase [Paenibacillus mesophilus]